MALHRTSFLHQSILKVVIHIFISMFFFIFKDVHRLVVNYFSIFKRIHPSYAHPILSLPSFFHHPLVNPKWHLLLHYVLRYLELITQLLRTDTISRIFDFILIKVGDHDGLNWKTFEREIPIIEWKSKVDEPKVVMEEYFSHGFDSGESCCILIKNAFILRRDVKWSCIFIVDGPITLWNS